MRTIFTNASFDKELGTAMSTTERSRVLIVEDDETTLLSVRQALEERGFEVIEARDGEQALICSERDAPDLIVLDVVMPKKSGFLVLDRIRKNKIRSPKIIICTASSEPKYREFAESRGIDDFIAKPFELDHLVARIEELLNA